MPNSNNINDGDYGYGGLAGCVVGQKEPFSFHCTICYEFLHPIDRPPMILPCGHTHICFDCSKRLDRCMECREPLMKTVKLIPIALTVTPTPTAPSTTPTTTTSVSSTSSSPISPLVSSSSTNTQQQQQQQQVPQQQQRKPEVIEGWRDIQRRRQQQNSRYGNRFSRTCTTLALPKPRPPPPQQPQQQQAQPQQQPIQAATSTTTPSAPPAAAAVAATSAATAAATTTTAGSTTTTTTSGATTSSSSPYQDIPLPTPKNLVLMSLIESMMQSYMKEELHIMEGAAGGDGGGANRYGDGGIYEDSKQNIEVSASTDEVEGGSSNGSGSSNSGGYQIGDDDEFVRDSMRIMNSSCGTYVVRAKEGLIVYDKPPNGSSSSGSGGGVDGFAESGLASLASRMGLLSTPKEVRKLKYGQKVQILSFENRVATVARNAGYIPVQNSNQLVKGM